MEASTAVSEAILDFYRGVTNKEIARFDEIVSSDHATLVIGTAPGEWVTERPRLRFGFETEGLTLEPGRNPVSYQRRTGGGALGTALPPLPPEKKKSLKKCIASSDLRSKE